MMMVFFLFILYSMVGVLIALSSSSPFTIWVGMELSTFFFLSTLFTTPLSVVSSWKYFLVQGVSSFLFYWGWVVGELNTEVDYYLVLLSLVIKLGSFPFIGWTLSLCESMSWWVFYLLGSLQKIVPLVVLSKFNDEMSQVSMSLGAISMMVLTFFFLSNSSIRWMMMYSSLFNLGWLIVGSSLGVAPLLTYMTIYFLTNLFVIYLFHSDEWDKESWAVKTPMVKWEENLMMVLLLLSLMGIPPLGTFLGKVELLSTLLKSESFLFPLLLGGLTAVISFFYVKIALSKGVMLNSSWIKVWSLKKIISSSSIVILFLLFWI